MHGYSIVILFSLLPNLRAKNLFAIHSFDINEFIDLFFSLFEKITVSTKFFQQVVFGEVVFKFFGKLTAFFTFLLMKNTFDWDCICFSKWRGSISKSGVVTAGIW